MRSLKYTRMGPAVRHATAKLAAQPSRTKLLIVISDGYPQDVDYGPVRGDHEYGLQDTARALREAVDAGVTPYLVTIDPAGHDYLRRMLPEGSYVVIDDVDVAAARAGHPVRQRGVALVARLVTSLRPRCVPRSRRRGAAWPTAGRSSSRCPRPSTRSRTAG